MPKPPRVPSACFRTRERWRVWMFLLCLAIAVGACQRSDPLERVRSLQKAGDFQGSLEPLRELIAERAKDPEVEYLYGLALSRTGQWSLAEWSLREAMKSPDWRVRAGSLLAEGALATENLPEAIRITTELLKVEPDNVNVLMMQANAYAHYKQDPERALEDVARVEALDPDYIQIMEPKILALLSLERYDDAGKALEELGKRIKQGDYGSDLEGWYCATAAIFAQESGKTDEATDRWNDCTKRFPTHPDVVSNSIDFFDSRGDYQRGLEILRAAYKEQPDSRPFRVVLAQRLRNLGSADEAETLLREAAEREKPQQAASAFVDLGKHYQAMEQYHKSAAAMDRALQAGREAGLPLAELRFDDADALVLDGQYDRALAMAAEMTVPAQQEMIRARVAQERGQYEEALKHFDKAFELWPNNPWARYFAGLAAESIGDFDRALKEYRYAIRIDVNSTDARVRMARIYAAERRPVDALEILAVTGAPLGPDGMVLSAELFGWVGKREKMGQQLAILAKRAPAELGRGLDHAARGIERRAGPRAAVAFLRGVEKNGVRLESPALADAMRALVRASAEAGQLQQAEASVRAALKSAPEAAHLHEILGLCRELAGAPDEARASYQRALELKGDDLEARLGLARLALPADPKGALEQFEKVTAADPNRTEALRGAAQALEALGRGEAAEKRWSELLEQDPHDAAAAARLAELELGRGVASKETLEHARRAVRFGGGTQALELLARVYRKRGDAAHAEQVLSRAKHAEEPEAGVGKGIPPGEKGSS